MTSCTILCELYLTWHSGQWKFVKKGEPAIVGITKLEGVTLEDLKRPRRKVSAESVDLVSPTLASESQRIPLDLP